VGAVCIWVPASDCWEKREPFRHQKWPFWRTAAAAWHHLCGRTGTCWYETTFYQLAVPTLVCATMVAGLHPNNNMWWISSKLILNCNRKMWENERQAGETTGN
jgi:hypothetical protein